MNAFWHWIPGTSVGPFTFGDQVAPYVRDYGLRKRKPDCPTAYWDTYEFPGFESWVGVENGRITGVHCVDGVEYLETNLIGMAASEVSVILGKEDKREDNVGLGFALYYDKLGLTLFMVNDIVSAAACGLVLED